MTLDQLTLDTFAPFRGDVFNIDVGEGRAVEARLSSATAGTAAAHAPGRRQPFSLVFTGPADVDLPQRIYRVTHERLGSLEIFLVPIGPGQDRGMRFEAVFN